MTWLSPFRRPPLAIRAIGLCVLASVCLLTKRPEAVAANRMSTVKFHFDENRLEKPAASETLPIAMLPVTKFPSNGPTVGKLVLDHQVQARIARAPERRSKSLAALPLVSEEFIAPVKQTLRPKARVEIRVGRVVAPSTTKQWVALYGPDYRKARTPIVTPKVYHSKAQGRPAHPG